MNRLEIKRSPEVIDKFAQYPEHIREKLEGLRSLIIETAQDTPAINRLEETLKWGEPSYLAKKGSTIRIDWKEKTPNHYAMYFKCTSKLVPTFKELYGDAFSYEANRAIRFGLDEPIPVQELKACIGMALRYHSLKELPLLGGR